MEEKRPKPAVGVLVWKDGKVLLGKRIKEDPRGVYCGPGGHLEQGESISECVRRETLEEAGIEIENIRFLSLTNSLDWMPKHYVNMGFLADWKSGDLQNKEPHVFESWDWYSIEELPKPLLSVVEDYLLALETGQVYFDNHLE